MTKRTKKYLIRGIFYAHTSHSIYNYIIRLSESPYGVIHYQVFCVRLVTNREDDNLSFILIISYMTKRNETVSNANNSTITTRLPQRNEDKILQLERRIKTLKNQNQQLEIENFQLKQQLRTETELKYMFGLFILEDEATERFNEWYIKGRPEHTDSWKNECLRYIKNSLIPNGIRELALKIETTK